MCSWEEHLLLLERLKGLKGRWVLSTYVHMADQVGSILGDGVYFVEVQTPSGMRRSKDNPSRIPNREVLVLSFPPPESVL